jgi:hypothetical protein
MLAILMALQPYVHRYGFLGIDGLVGLVIGILNAALAVFPGITEGMKNLIRWCIILLVFVVFLHLFGLY